ncbi:MAG: hypothetical protein JST85_00810 [Acidobacteria bacterium]|nr:hypothetical protein [Acidobacteriota bacterium]
MPTILDFQIQPLSAESYSLIVCERGSSQPLASATFSHRVDFLADFSVDWLNAPNSVTKDAAERFDELQKLPHRHRAPTEELRICGHSPADIRQKLGN